MKKLSNTKAELKKALLIKKLADDGHLLQQSRLVKFGDFSVARVANVNHHIISIF